LILHDDDYLLDGGLEAIVAALHRHPDRAVLVFGVALVDLQEHELKRQVQDAGRYLPPPEALRRLLVNSSFIRTPALVVRRDAYDEVGLYDHLGGPEDVDMEVRLFARFGMQQVAATTAAYTIHPGAATTSMFNEGTIDKLLAVFDRALGTGVLDAETVRRSQTDFFHQFILAGAWRSLRAGDRADAARVLKLLDLPPVRELGVSSRWLPVRLAFRALTVGAG
jgi:hypothetical protein